MVRLHPEQKKKRCRGEFWNILGIATASVNGKEIRTQAATNFEKQTLIKGGGSVKLHIDQTSNGKGKGPLPVQETEEGGA